MLSSAHNLRSTRNLTKQVKSREPEQSRFSILKNHFVLCPGALLVTRSGSLLQAERGVSPKPFCSFALEGECVRHPQFRPWAIAGAS